MSMTIEEIEEKLGEAVEQLVDQRIEMLRGVEIICPSRIPWESHKIDLHGTKEETRFRLYLSYTVGGFWVCGHYFGRLEDDEGEE